MAAGLDSLGALDVRRQVSDLAGTDMPATLVFDYPTIEEMAKFVASKAMESVAAAAKQSKAAVAPRSGGAAPARQRQRAPAGAVAAATRRTAPSPAPALTAQHKLERVTDKVRQCVHKLLGGAEVAASTPLSVAGMDSLGALELRKELGSVFGIDLPATFLFDYPTIEAVAEELADRVSNASLGFAAPEPAVDLAAAAPAEDAFAAGGSQQAEAAEQEPAANGAAARPAKPSRPVNKNAPTLTLPEFFTVPSIRQLARASDEQLKAVHRFVIGRKDLGEVAFLYPVDLRGLDLDQLISIERGSIDLYPAPAGSNTNGDKAVAAAARKLPPPGRGLNQPALLTFRRMAVKKPDDQKLVAAFKKRLQEASERMGGVFVHYDSKEAVWMMKLDAWQ
ncbi:hypothetical protein ABPG75_012122 [Micractinium tetrahymenae]